MNTHEIRKEENEVKKLLCLAMCLMLVLPCLTALGEAVKKNEITVPELSTVRRPIPDNEAMTFLKKMGVGWNLGNTFDATKGTWNANADEMTVESSWCGVETTELVFDALKEAGFDFINTASNHCMDSLKDGIGQTLDVLEANGLDHIGTYRSQEEWDANHGIVVKDVNGISIAFLSYTYGTNCIPIDGFEYVTNLAFKDYMDTYADEITEVDWERLDADMAYARDLDTDVICVFIHWGLEYHTAPVDYQREIADHLFEQGATLVCGGHPHVPEPMEVRRVLANDNAEDDRGKVALERGPVVFCLEGKDQPDNTVFDKYILDSTPIQSHFEKDLLNGVVVLEGNAKELQRNGEVKDVRFRAIPYSTWNNRGGDQMEVWIANTPAKAVATPLPTIASRAQTFSNRGPIQNDAPETAPTDSWAGGVNDQWEPKRSSDTSKPYHYWWLKRGTTESISYKFKEAEEVSNVQVYWLDFDHYDGDFRVPESWTLYYETADGNWKEVEDHSPFTVKKDCYNSIDFKPVKTKGLKIVAKLQKGQSGGMLEWKVN